MISFNMSVSGDKTWLKNTTEPFQILPQQRGYLTYDQTMMYPKKSKTNEDRDILVHTSYICKPFSDINLDWHSKCFMLLYRYYEFCERIGTRYLLIHGPENLAQWMWFDVGLNAIKKSLQVIPDDYNEGQELVMRDIVICIEVPSFNKEMFKKFPNQFEFMDKYFKKVVDVGFEIVIDTAHTFNNKLTNEEVLKLMEKYKDHMTWIHLNGNIRPPETSDTHCPMFDKKNLIPNPIEFTKEIMKFGKKCICEIVYPKYDEWAQFAKDVGGKLISKELFEHL